MQRNRGVRWLVAHRRLGLLALAALVVAVIGIVATSLAANRPESTAFDQQSEWAVETGFDITVDSEGFRFPSAIAFIPNPGTSPKDPLYFVTELRGKVKVVTNDRTVFTFAEDFFSLRPKQVNPTIDESVGMAGICLAPNLGYVFVTFAYQDANNILRNNIVRFQSNPETFSIAPTSQIDFTEVFARQPTSAGHQIGPCQVRDDLLYVSVADAFQSHQSQRMDTLLGKILRMTLDGLPAPENPFYRDDSIGNPRNYIWASGFRNPFGLKIVDDRVFVADNGPVVDRFLQVREGGNYLWDGTDMSFGTNADAAFFPGRGVAQVDRYPPNSSIFPDRFKNSFFMTMTGNPVVRREGFPAIWVIPYDFSQDKLSAVPTTVLRHRGRQIQIVSGLGFGPDGLYFAAMLPNNGESSQVLKITYAPEANYPFNLEEKLNPVVLIRTNGCLACHALGDNEGEAAGPTLERDSLVPRLAERLSSEAYSSAVKELDDSELEPFASYRDARNAIAQAQGLEQIRLWVYNRILEPRFDDPNAAMPQLGLTNQQAKAIADYLVGAPKEAVVSGEGPSLRSRVMNLVNTVLIRPLQDRLPYPTRENSKKYLASAFAVGFFMGVLILVISLGFFFYIRRNRNRKESE